MVSVLHKEVEYKVEKLKYKKVGGYLSELAVVNKPFWNSLGHQLRATWLNFFLSELTFVWLDGELWEVCEIG